MLNILLLSYTIIFSHQTLPEALCKASEDCYYLAQAGYYESRSEPDKGVESVMKVVINRKNHNRFPNTIKDVVLSPYAFSYVHDGSLTRARYNGQQWQRMYRIALKVLFFPKSVDIGGATHYHTKRVSPFWNRKFKQVASIGAHEFYKCFGYC